MKANYDFSNTRRGAVAPQAGNKTRITIRLDGISSTGSNQRRSLKGGGSYQVLLNDALRAYTKQEDQPLEKILRKVVREEIKKAS